MRLHFMHCLQIMCAVASQSTGEDVQKALKVWGLWKSSGFFPSHLKEWKARITTATDAATRELPDNNSACKNIDQTEVVERRDKSLLVASEAPPVAALLMMTSSRRDQAYGRCNKIMWALFDDLAGQYRASDKDGTVSRTAHGPCSGRLANNARSSLDALDFVKSAAFWFLCRHVYSGEAREGLHCNTAALVLGCVYLAGKVSIEGTRRLACVRLTPALHLCPVRVPVPEPGQTQELLQQGRGAGPRWVFRLHSRQRGGDGVTCSSRSSCRLLTLSTRRCSPRNGVSCRWWASAPWTAARSWSSTVDIRSCSVAGRSGRPTCCSGRERSLVRRAF